MGYQTIEDDIKSGKTNIPAPILLFGEERFLVSHYEKILGGRAMNELDISVFYADEATDEAIIASLETFPMLSPYRIVIVRDYPGFSAKSAQEYSGDGLTAYIKNPPENSRLIFSSETVNKTRSVYKAIAKYGTVYEFTRLDEAGLRNFIIKRFNSLNAKITKDVLDEFIYATAYLDKNSDRDLFTVENDVFKTASYALAEGREVITQRDVEECLPGVLRTDVFAMLDAISSGKKAEAVRLLESSLSEGENVFRLLSLITGHFEIMLGYKELSAQGKRPGEITSILGERSEWRVKRLGGFAQRIELSKLKDILMNLYDMERSIKSGDISERLAFTVLFAEI